MKDSWKAGDAYDYYMGRWSRLVAKPFIDWLSPSDSQKWLDIGCGSGALSETILANCQPAALTAIDPSEGFVQTAQMRLGDRANCKVSDAQTLPLESNSINITVSGLVLNFIPEPKKALAEMMRVTQADGTVAAYVWDYAGQMEFLRYFWDAAMDFDPNVSNAHEAYRFPNANKQDLEELFEAAGFEDVMTTHLAVTTKFQDFDDYWLPFLGGQGPAPTYVQSLDATSRSKLKNALYERLPIADNGSISLTAGAWAIKGLAC